MLDLAIFRQLYINANLNLNRYGSLTSSEQPTETPLEQTPFSYSPRCHHTPAMPRYVVYKNRRNIWSLINNSLEVFIVTALRSPPQLPQQRQQQKQQPQRGRNTT